MNERVCAPLDKIPQALAKTGFIVEHLVAEEFRKSGWSTIGGRYYADDVDGRARELDLVAYRIRKAGELEVVSAVLISCKKDEETTWTFLTKGRPKQDPNFDWDPVHYWTDVQPLREYLSSEPWKDGYIKEAGSLYSSNARANKDVFAFQQVASQRVVPRNDKAIFDSISTLMKALDHEVEAVPTRAKGKRRVYLFSLLSVVDAPMVDVSYADKEPVAVEIDQLTHLARYMVKRRDLSALINFVRMDNLPKFVSVLSKLADVNAKHMGSLVNAACKSVRSNQKVQKYFAGILKTRIAWRVKRSFRENAGLSFSVDDMQLSYVNETLMILIDIFDNGDLAILNSDDELRAETAKILKDFMRYEGKFEFGSSFPF